MLLRVAEVGHQIVTPNLTYGGTPTENTSRNLQYYFLRGYGRGSTHVRIRQTVANMESEIEMLREMNRRIVPIDTPAEAAEAPNDEVESTAVNAPDESIQLKENHSYSYSYRKLRLQHYQSTGHIHGFTPVRSNSTGCIISSYHAIEPTY